MGLSVLSAPVVRAEGHLYYRSGGELVSGVVGYPFDQHGGGVVGEAPVLMVEDGVVEAAEGFGSRKATGTVTDNEVGEAFQAEWAAAGAAFHDAIGVEQNPVAGFPDAPCIPGG
jgi:hypothetical protein